MNLEELSKRVQDFDKNVDWGKTSIKEIVDFMQQEMDKLKSDSGNKNRVNHLLTDLLVLILQAGYKNKTDFNLEIEKWFVFVPHSKNHPHFLYYPTHKFI